MKILKIEFTNINSLRGSHTIDFTKEPFISSSLFAITGPTGSGKSTLLDVIALALYGKIPRIPGSRPISKSDIEKFGTILTRNQKEAIARVTYECKYGIFSSQWNISTNRNDNLRDNDMEIFDHQKQELVTDKKSEVPEKNEELIGLNYDQFIKAVLLAQGEFAQFLKVSKKERGALLEKITGTGIYRLIGQKVYERNGILNKDIEQQQNEIKIIQDSLLEDENLSLKKKELQNKTEILDNCRKDIDDLNETLKIKEAIRKKSDEIKKLEEDKSSARKDLESFNMAHGAPLEQHERVQDISEELRNWNLLQKEIINLKSEQSKVLDGIKDNTKNIDQVISEISILTKTEINSSNFSQNLSAFRDKVINLHEQRKEKINEYKLEKANLDAKIQHTEILFKESAPEETANEIQRKITSTEKAIKDWKNKFKIINFEEINELKVKLQNELKNTRDAARGYQFIEKKQLELNRISNDLKNLHPHLKSLPTKIDNLDKEVSQLKSDLEILNLKQKNQLLESKLEDLRNELVSGKPCPLCGAEHHPYADHLPQKNDKLEEEIVKVKKQLDDLLAAFNIQSANLKNYKNQANEYELEIQTLQKDIGNLNSEFSKKYKGIPDAENLQEYENRCDHLEDKIENLTLYQENLKSLEYLKSALPIIHKLCSTLAEGKKLKEKIDTQYSGNNIQHETENYQNLWTSLQSDLKNLNKEKEKLEKLHEEKLTSLLNLENTLMPQLISKGIQKLADGFSALIPESDVTKLRLERQHIQKKIDNTAANLEILISQLKELEKQDITKKEGELKESLIEKNKQFQLINDEYIEIKRILKNQEENLNRMLKLKDQIAYKEMQTRRWRMLNELIGDRTGNKFNDFAQDLTLSRLIKLANIRLKDLSDRYLIDKPTDEEDDGLVAIDEHMGGQRRSVKTLSGGETFILSLSMALALSDLASKNVEINSLFIDEGFGTLDPETLDQTLDTLEKLQAESSKTIGVISHVESLKERITTQIKLSRNGQGYSSLEVV